MAAKDSVQPRRSLRWELIAVLAILLMMAVVSLSLATELLGRRRHFEQQRIQLLEHAEGLASLVAPRIGSGATTFDANAIEQALRPSLGAQGIEAIELYRLPERGPDAIVAVGRTEPLAPPGRGDPRSEGVLLDDGRLVVDHALPAFGSSATPVVLRIVARPSPWTRMTDWQDVLFLAVGVGALLLVLGVLLLELQVLRPLGNVRRAVGEVARGNLDAEVPEEGPAELQSLAGSFNQMTGALRQRIEEIEAQRERLVRADQLASVGRIAAGTAHEVGNPLAAILGYVELLLDPRTDPPLSEEQSGLLERSRTQLLRIQTIIGQLLEYSRPSPDPSGAKLEPVRLHAQAQSLLGLLKHDPRCKDVQIEVAGDAQLQALADGALLDQVVVNLVVNAARAARGGDDPPQVRIRVSGGAKHPRIEVQDNGPGVPDDVRPHLFEPFFTTAAAGEGTGLGLAICQGLVENMGGELTCLPPNSRDPLPESASEGAVFVVELESAQRAPASEPEPSAD
jgi:signal transduction histidine kinase